jgi:hypothetical protein
MHPTYRIDQRAEMWEQLFIFGWCAEFFLDHSAGLRGRFSVDREDDVNFSPGFIERSAFSIFELEKREWSIFYPGHVLAHLPPDFHASRGRRPYNVRISCL